MPTHQYKMLMHDHATVSPVYTNNIHKNNLFHCEHEDTKKRTPTRKGGRNIGMCKSCGRRLDKFGSRRKKILICAEDSEFYRNLGLRLITRCIGLSRNKAKRRTSETSETYPLGVAEKCCSQTPDATSHTDIWFLPADAMIHGP